MAEILQLPQQLADMIAAGEVVERPASVVKELLENAIDAGASAVTVEIQNGGVTYIRVSDNGCGIAPHELPTAFLRHATSKLRSQEQLSSIETLGFRGEALAAIASVSRIEIFSRTKEAASGASLTLTGGAPGPVEAAGCPEGTTIIVRDLFFNTPARMKFLKKDSAEAAAVSSVVQHIAISHPEVSVRFLRDGQEALHTPGDAVLKSAVYAAFGREFALGLVDVHGADGALRVDGFAARPVNARGSRAMQTFFVNGRIVKSQLLTAALEEAYANRLLKGRFPGCVLHITIPCDMVDVNVHPAKTIVKFINERQVFSAVHHIVSDALDEKPPAPKPTVQSGIAKPRGDFYRTMTSEQFRAHAAAAEKKPVAAPVQPPAFQTRIPSAQTELRTARVASDALRDKVIYTVERAPMQENVPPSDTAPKIERVSENAVEPVLAPLPEPAFAEGAAHEQLSLVPGAAPWRIAGEVLNTYIICEDEDGCVHLVDKHAAHERINFDRLKSGAAPIESQQLLSPVAVQLAPEECTALLEQLPLLEEFGFLCEDFGGSCILIRAIPTDIAEGEASGSLEELARRLLRDHRADSASARDALFHTIACKSAIRAGMHSGESELRALVDRVQSGEVRYCPHGRPVCATMTKYELERMFKRV
ncbi:MAG: DNA mismatch repair endonuclease MutL [Oscillospiraceae bacterium]|nr:DNA mismatch repair endonuclease MutL [Oscillospiraceae bacterium]